MRKRRFSRRKILALALGAFVLFVWLNNTSLWVDPVETRPQLVAHRGLGQSFAREGLTGTTCTAARMLPPEHEFLENTLASMRAAFDYGADMVELDVHPTTDGRFAVFHDWTLDCRTDGTGLTRDHSLEELQRLDVGYGYTADGGETFPFRGRGVGRMPSLDEVLRAFPDRAFLIDIKGNTVEEGERLGEFLAGRLSERSGEIALTGGADAVAAARARLPEIRAVVRPLLKRCLKRYLALGWSGHVPSECENGLVFVPANVAPWLWGWPHRFGKRMERAGSSVVLLGDYDGESFSMPLDDPERLKEIPAGYGGGVWTDRVDRIGPVWTER